ncbi:MAG: SurA N-terminal domain-containing protein [Candidatus Riflebacteria bacterium]|nr:SurA N-terminal domain-containing protein [Candidatus Riflebacteria bacterium]
MRPSEARGGTLESMNHGARDDLPLAARVNGQPITRLALESVLADVIEHYARKGQTVTPEERHTLERQVLDQLVERELIFQECRRLDRKVDDETLETRMGDLARKFGGAAAMTLLLARQGLSLDDVRSGFQRDLLIDDYIESVLYSGVRVSDAETRGFFDDNRARFRIQEQVRVSLLTLSLGKRPPAGTVRRAREAMAALGDRLRAGDDFHVVGKEANAQRDDIQVSDLGFITRGRLLPDLEAAAFLLWAGQLSPVVITPVGMHILKVSDHLIDRDLRFDEVAPEISKLLLSRKREDAARERLVGLKQTALIEIFPTPPPPEASSGSIL